jgi:DNA-binding response OmpR family regulator/HPt (histidine-containing phosphotransfer) domain-containing protein
MTGAGARERVQAATDALWQQVQRTELARAAVISSAVAALLEGRLDEHHRALAEREAHKIAGSAGMFGYGQASEIARELEAILSDRGTGRAASAVALAEDLGAALRAAPAAPAVPEAGPGEEEPAVLILHPCAAVSLAVAEDLRTRGFVPEIVADLTAARDAVQGGRRPTAAVVHLSSGPDARGTDDLLGDLDRLGTAVVGLLPANAGTASRVAALRAGARLLLDAPLDPAAGAARIADAVATLINDPQHSVPRVLAVDDDEAVLQAVRHLLGTTSVRVETLREPEGFWAALGRFQPDLLLLDVDMPGVSGLELCRLVRSDPRWSQLPVVFLSGSHDAEAVRRVYAAGADDFVSKPVAGPELQARIASRLDRARLHRLLAETDPLTGLANRRRLERDLNRLQLLADRYSSHLSLAVVDGSTTGTGTRPATRSCAASPPTCGRRSAARTRSRGSAARSSWWPCSACAARTRWSGSAACSSPSAPPRRRWAASSSPSPRAPAWRSTTATAWVSRRSTGPPTARCAWPRRAAAPGSCRRASGCRATRPTWTPPSRRTARSSPSC